MNNELTFSDGTFAGQKIRVTEDGYASIYDIMKVAGVGDEPTNTWNKLKMRFLDPQSTSRTSGNGNPTVKSFKFTGRGQRDTPVINGAGLVRLLFLLPGIKARQFVAESAETLVRYIGGDESLIEEIRRNRETALVNPSSAQSFMRKNIEPTTSAVSTIENNIELEERRARLVRLQNENAYQEEVTKAYKLDVLDKYKVYAMENITDSRIKERIQNEITNRK
jgi:hypothetical protein